MVHKGAQEMAGTQEILTQIKLQELCIELSGPDAGPPLGYEALVFPTQHKIFR
jgi:hypothetical protein